MLTPLLLSPDLVFPFCPGWTAVYLSSHLSHGFQRGKEQDQGDGGQGDREGRRRDFGHFWRRTFGRGQGDSGRTVLAAFYALCMCLACCISSLPSFSLSSHISHLTFLSLPLNSQTILQTSCYHYIVCKPVGRSFTCLYSLFWDWLLQHLGRQADL